MSPKAIWFTTIGISSLTLVAAFPLGQAAAKLWKPEVAHAAKVTIHLVKNKSLNPVLLSRRSRTVMPLVQSGHLLKPASENVALAGLSQQIGLSYPAFAQPIVFSESMTSGDRFNPETANYRIAPQEFQQLVHSSKMTD